MKTAISLNSNRQAIKLLVRAREDFQAMRKRMDNRIGRKADGGTQDIEEREFRGEDIVNFCAIADAARQQEKEIAKMLKKALKEFPIYTEYLADIKGVGEVAAGWIIGEFDINRATTVSKLWQFSGLNPGMVKGQKRVDIADGTFTYVRTDTMVRGDRLTAGFVAPFNKRLRTALVGVMADGFIKQQNIYCLDYYYPYKIRLEHEAGVPANADPAKAKPWSDVSKGHRDRAAKRYMVKMFLQDLYVAWRNIEGLPVREPYREEYLGRKHAV